VRSAPRLGQRHGVTQFDARDGDGDNPLGIAPGDVVTRDADGDAFGRKPDERHWIVSFKADLWLQTVRAEGAVDDAPRRFLRCSQNETLLGDFLERDGGSLGEAVAG